ncbi:MAG: transglycosylase domain-containing protein [Firmicutes bacterium]|nr:transglycosylase domain-containing protein [Bacillota bacterium]
MSDFNKNKYDKSSDEEFFSKFETGTQSAGDVVPDTIIAQGKDADAFRSELDAALKADKKAPPAPQPAIADAAEPKQPKSAKPTNKGKGKADKKKSGKKSVAFASIGKKAKAPINYKPDGTGMSLLKLLISISTIGVLAIGILVGIIFITAPAINTDDIYSNINQRSVLYDCNGKEIENLYYSDGNRTVVKYDKIPENMKNAVISIEDQKFYKHNGFNFIRIVGAIKDSVFGGGQISGTSTITQQLARNVYLSEIMTQRSMSRKITEMYYTIIIEKDLTKEQIMEAYLNTIYLGFNSYGIETASQSYFSKSAEDLDLLECASLAALPQSPDTYALVYSDYYNSITGLPVIKKTPSVTYLYNGDLSKDRRELVLSNMLRLGYIDESEYNEAIAEDLQSDIKIGASADASNSSYFTDYAIKQVTDDFVSELGMNETDAQNLIYTGGLKIYTTMDSDIQKIMEEEFKDDANYTTIAYTRTNADNNIISEDGVVLAYAYTNYFDGKDNFVLKGDEFKKNDDGGITIYGGKRLNLYDIEVDGNPDVSIEFKNMYKTENGIFYFIESGALSIPQGYKSKDNNGNCVISAQFFEDYPDFFKKSGNDLVVDENSYSLKQKVRQPQAAAVIIENKTGSVKGMMGGRGASGKQLYNRAVNPRQPGSSIKPLAVYGPALQMSFEYLEDNKKLSLDTSDGSDWGRYVTAGSIVNDALTRDGNGKVWPLNDDHSYHGTLSVRRGLQQSLNVVSYKIYKQIAANEGPEYCIDMLKKVGITTLNEEADANPAAMALGGLTNGLSPLEEAAAYATFPNGGVYKTPIFYNKVIDSKDNTILEKVTEETQVYDKGVAWIMTDVLRTVVTNGIAGSAAISSQPVGGKTGTTSNMYDIWFSGFTPQYTMSLWMGNDINMSVSNYSYKAAGFWSAIMGRVCDKKTTTREDFFKMPSNVVRTNGEYYIDGTYSVVHGKKKEKTKDESSSTTIEPTTAPTVPTVTDPPTPTPTAPSPTNPTPAPTTSGGGGGGGEGE